MAAFIKTRGEQYKLKPDASLSEALDVVNASEGGWLAEITDQHLTGNESDKLQ